MNFLLAVVLTSIVIFSSTDGFASGAVARKRQMAMMQQQAVEQAYMQQAAAQQQQAQAEAQQQVVAQQEQQIAAQIQQQQAQAIAQQLLMQVQQQQQAYVAQVRAVQVQYANKQEEAMVASLAQQYQQAVIEEAIKQKLVLDAVQMAQVQQLAQAKAQAEAVQAFQMKQQAQGLQAQAAGQYMQKQLMGATASDKVQDVVDISDVWRKLDVDSRTWTLLIDNQDKVATVNEYIDRFNKQSIKIKNPAVDYVHMIDDMAMQDPELLKRPFKDILQLMAVMQYDFDNGMNKDELAQKMLGPQLYLSNRKRLGH